MQIRPLTDCTRAKKNVRRHDAAQPESQLLDGRRVLGHVYSADAVRWA